MSTSASRDSGVRSAPRIVLRVGMAAQFSGMVMPRSGH
jgi:hypothetical protein